MTQNDVTISNFRYQNCDIKNAKDNVLSIVRQHLRYSNPCIEEITFKEAH